jgi:hypothetical protein
MIAPVAYLLCSLVEIRLVKDSQCQMVAVAGTGAACSWAMVRLANRKGHQYQWDFEPETERQLFARKGVVSKEDLELKRK